MTLKILAIGDLGNNISTLKKFIKSSEIHLINFNWEGNSAVMDERNDTEFFSTNKMSDFIKRINEIKNDFDICLAMSSTGLLVSYLANLNYIAYFVGHEIRSPPFIKNSNDPLSTEQPIYDFNFLERWFYKKAYENAIACVVSDDELLNVSQKYQLNTIRISGYIEDTTIFNQDVKPIERKKTKFTFLSPARMGLQKGTDKIWEALDLCKTNFEVLQVKWYDKRTPKEKQLAEKWIKNKPSKVKFLPIMKREELAKYFMFADAVLGQVRGLQGCIERQALFCKKPLVHYSNPEYKFVEDVEKIKKPFILNSNEPSEIAQIIDTIVESKENLDNLAAHGSEFVKIVDPSQIAHEWDEIFENYYNKFKKIERETSHLSLLLLRVLYLIGNRLHYRKLKKLLRINNG